MGYFQVCMHLQVIRSKEEDNKYNNQQNLQKLGNKIQVKEYQRLIKKEKIKVKLVKIILIMADNNSMNLSLLILRILKSKVTMKRRVARKEKIKEIA